MANLKKVDSGLLPPCSKNIQNKLQRAHYNSIIWGCADSANPGYELIHLITAENTRMAAMFLTDFVVPNTQITYLVLWRNYLRKMQEEMLQSLIMGRIQGLNQIGVMTRTVKMFEYVILVPS